MSDDDMKKEGGDSKQITRRKVLGALGTTAGTIATTGLVETASAKSESIDEIRDYKEVQNLLAVVGDPEISSEEISITKIEGVTILAANLETEIGTAIYLEALNSDVAEFGDGYTSTKFEIKDLTRETRQKLPARFSNIPTGVDMSVRVNSGNVSIATTTTEEERKQLAELVDVEEFTTRYVNGDYYIITKRGIRYKASGNINRPKIKDPSIESLSTAQISDACLNCATLPNLSSCATCIEPCELFAGHGNPLDCAHCVVKNCAVLDIVPCTKCIADIANPV